MKEEKNSKPDGLNANIQSGSDIVAAGMQVMEDANEANRHAADALDGNTPTPPPTADGNTPTPPTNDGGGSDPMAANFTSLPMRDLIGAPLLAAAEAQQQLAAGAWDFYKRIAFKDDGKEARTLDFTLDRPVTQDGKVTTIQQQVKAPFIGLVPIPSLLIDRIDVDFQMEVTATNTEKSSSQAEATTNMSYKSWFGLKADISGKVTSSRENTRQTDQTAKYQVHVSASQQPQTEGLSKLMDIMNSCIQPIDPQ